MTEREIFNIPIRRLAAKLAIIVQREVLRPFDLRIQEWRIIWSLAREGDAHLRELARRASVDPSHVSRLLTKLEKDGVAERYSDPTDARRTTFRLTDKGHEIYVAVRPVATEVSDRFRALYTPEEYATLMALLARASSRADEMLAQTSGETSPEDD